MELSDLSRGRPARRRLSPEQLWTDDADPLAEDPWIVALLEEPVGSLVGTKGLLDDLLEELEQPGPELDQPDESGNVENPYSKIFLTPDEDEVALSDLLQQVSTTSEVDYPDLQSSTQVIEEGDNESNFWFSQSESPANGFSYGGIIAGGAVLAVGAMVARRHVGTTREQEKEIVWYYSLNGQQHDPLSEQNLKEKLRLGQLSDQGYVWREGMSQWVTVSEAGLCTKESHASLLQEVQCVEYHSLFCSQCGNENQSNSKFCSKCGQQI